MLQIQTWASMLLVVFSPRVEALLVPASSGCRTFAEVQNPARSPCSARVGCSSTVSLRASPNSPQTQHDDIKTVSCTRQNSVDWVNLGFSFVYLAQFASLYTQLPGLYGSNGLLPIADVEQVERVYAAIWAMDVFPSAEFGMESFCTLGILVSALQIMFPALRCGLFGVATYTIDWLLWHDLVVTGGRFTQYQMDTLLLDAAPVAVLAASRFAPVAASFGYRWLLARLYLGAGAVKLLSCDESWRDLSAVHWHLQSQPLPNILGVVGHRVLGEGRTHPLTAAVLVVEMAAPFLFLAPSRIVRRSAFVLNALLMTGIMTFGNFGTLQVFLLIVGLALFDDLPPSPTEIQTETTEKEHEGVHVQTVAVVPVPQDTFRDNKGAVSYLTLGTILSTISIFLAAAASWWTVSNIHADSCGDTLAVAPLVYSMLLLGLLASVNSPSSSTSSPLTERVCSLFLLAGSVVPLAYGLGVPIPFPHTLEVFNVGAGPYGLFATMTGVDGGRPTEVMEGAYSLDGPWTHVPLLYQVNDPATPPPLCVPHFPRFDWTLWFVPLGETGPWIGRLVRGILWGDTSVLSLLDGQAFHRSFADGPPDFIRMSREVYSWMDGGGWEVMQDSSKDVVIFSRNEMLPTMEGINPWPSIPLVRSVAESVRPEQFVWFCLVLSEVGRRVMSTRAYERDEGIDVEGR